MAVGKSFESLLRRSPDLATKWAFLSHSKRILRGRTSWNKKINFSLIRKPRRRKEKWKWKRKCLRGKSQRLLLSPFITCRSFWGHSELICGSNIANNWRFYKIFPLVQLVLGSSRDVFIKVASRLGTPLHFHRVLESPLLTLDRVLSTELKVLSRSPLH